jgi:large subunit ribosomal protein L10
MSKVIKQMEMTSLQATFKDVRDMVLLSVTGLNSIADNQVRLALRKKGIRLQMVKNSLTRRIFADMGVKIAKGWEGPTTLAWGGSSVAELSKEISPLLKKYEKNFKVKSAVADGQEVTFEQALKMPTKAEIIGTILAMILGPGSQIAGQIAGPASQIAGQLKTLSEKKPEEQPAAAEAAPAATEAAPAAAAH